MNNERQVTKEPKAISQKERGVFCSNAGSRIAPVYKRVYDDELKRSIVKHVDDTDIYEFIQASKSTTDLATLQQRFIALGEIPNVDPTLGSNDLAVFPSDIHGIYDMVNDVDGAFNKLPESIKSIFGTSDAYLKSLLNGTYQATIYKAIQDSQKVPTDTQKEVNTNE